MHAVARTNILAKSLV